MHSKSIILILMLAVAHSAMALVKIPTDPDVRIGTLPNGLTYYIRHNAEPAGLADFFIAQRVGAIQEDEDQQGLAHFLEHMCFNGTEHFPGNSLIDYLESVGVKFGANLNAYTASDETVYNISRVPVDRVTTQDSCLLILRDWSHGLTLDPKEIDAERGVIVGEWRQRIDSPSERLLQKTVPIIYPDSRYGQRMPIGKMDVVENFQPETLEAFYHKWYNPENQCIIVVGDIDPAYTEAKIKDLFSDIPKGDNPVTVSRVPENSQVIATLQTDPEQPYTAITLYVKHDDIADSEAGTIAEVRRDLIRQLVASMLVERFDQLELDPAVPFTNVGIGDLNFLLSRHQQALLIRANAKNGNAEDCVKAFAKELKRAARLGFNQTELDRAKLGYRTDLDAEFANRDKVTNTEYARKYVRHYIDGGVLPSMEAYYKMMRGVVSNTTLQDVNDYISEIIRHDDSNVVIYVYAPDSKPSSTSILPVYPSTSSTLSRAYTQVDVNELTPWVDVFEDTQLMTTEPTAGSILSVDSLPAFEARVLTLSNGIRVYLKQTHETPDRVLIAGYSPGGFSQGYDVELVPDYLLCNDVLAVSGCNGLPSTQLKKMLVGKDVKSSIKVDNMEESVSASASVNDLETALQLIYLKATSLSADTAAYHAMMANQRLKFENRNTNATIAMGDSIHLNVYNRHPLGAKLTAEDIDKANYQTIMDIYRDRFGDMGDFSFFIVGDFDDITILPLIERYIASLPSNGRKERPQDIGYGYYQGHERRIFERNMEMPQSICYTFLNGECPYDVDHVISASAFGQILSARLRKDIREDRGWTYGVKSHCSVSAGMNGDDPSRFILPVYIKVKPEHLIECADIVTSTINSLSNPGEITAEEVSSVAAYMRKNALDNASDPSYWLLVMHLYDKFGVDMHTSYLSSVDALTPERISSFAKTHILPASSLQLLMQPK